MKFPVLGNTEYPAHSVTILIKKNFIKLCKDLLTKVKSFIQIQNYKEAMKI